jgi:hypothetical protein
MAASRDKQQEKEKEADTMMKKANKLIKPSLFDFRLKPDWEEAAPLFEKAALLYKVMRRCDPCSDAWRSRACRSGPHALVGRACP